MPTETHHEVSSYYATIFRANGVLTKFSWESESRSANLAGRCSMRLRLSKLCRNRHFARCLCDLGLIPDFLSSFRPHGSLSAKATASADHSVGFTRDGGSVGGRTKTPLDPEPCCCGLLARNSLSVGRLSMPGTRISLSGAAGRSISGASSETGSWATAGASIFAAGASSTTDALGAHDASARVRQRDGRVLEIEITMGIPGDCAAAVCHPRRVETMRFAPPGARPNRSHNRRETGLAGQPAAAYAPPR